jgi:drug/metabolite transporter (DMT)-like permease
MKQDITALKDSDFEGGGGGGGGGGGSVGVGGGGGDGGGDGGSGESDKGGPSHSFIGDAVCLLGAVLYAVYTVLHLRARADQADGP